jgi:hypothetical protein
MIIKEKKTQQQISQQKRFLLREKLKNNYLIPKIGYLFSSEGKKKKFSTLLNYGNIFIKHFTENPIPMLNKNNCYGTNNGIFKDYRDGFFFQKSFLPLILNKNEEIFLYQLYFDGTKVFNNNSINCYLTVLNDKLTNFNKKIIYNLSFIKPSNLKLITMPNYLNFIVNKLKKECSKIQIKQKIYCGYLFSYVGDNAEIYSMLNLKISFSNSIFRCRCCDTNTQQSNEDTKKDFYKFKLKNNTIYKKEVILRNSSKYLQKIYNPSAVSNCFLFNYVHYLWSFPLDVQHNEFEGEIQRELILFCFFYNQTQLIETSNEFKLMILFLTNYIKTTNIIYFFENISRLNSKVF